MRAPHRCARSARGSGQHTLGVVFRPASGVPTTPGIASELIIDVGGKVIYRTSYAVTAPSFRTGGTVPLTITLANHGTAQRALGAGQRHEDRAARSAAPGSVHPRPAC
jgi:hypothetical protein